MTPESGTAAARMTREPDAAVYTWVSVPEHEVEKATEPTRSGRFKVWTERACAAASPARQPYAGWYWCDDFPEREFR